MEQDIFDWQLLIVLAAFLAAIVYLFRKLSGKGKKSDSTGCDKCDTKG